MSVNVFASNTIFGCFYFRYYHCTDTAIFPLRLSQFHIRLPRLGLYMRKGSGFLTEYQQHSNHPAAT